LDNKVVIFFIFLYQFFFDYLLSKWIMIIDGGKTAIWFSSTKRNP